MRTRWHSLAMLALLAPLALLGLSGCDQGSDGDAGDDVADSATSMGTSSDTGSETGTETHGETQGDTEASNCAAETRDDDFAIGLSKSGALIQATFVSADPAPPIKGDNTWVIDFTDLQDQALADLTITANPMMPDHGHGTPITALVSATATPGQYEITPVNLFMAGYWQITLDVTLGGGEQDSVMFGFCVE